jgi:hypothetical protein
VRGVGFRLSTDLLRTASTGGGAGSSDRDLVPA